MADEIKQSERRLVILEKIEELEKNGTFDQDVEADPPTLELKPEKMDYLRKKWINKIKTKIGNFLAARYIEKLIKNEQINIKEIIGIEHFNKLEGGAIITCNHFHPFDNFVVQKVFEKVQKKGQKMWKVIREGNYTNPPCLKFFFRNCDTFPLSQNLKTMINFMRALKTVLNRGDYVLIYPEQSMWWNYRKPKPLKEGSFKFAVQNNVPVIPIFITMKDMDKLDGEGFPMQEYYVHVLEPIYPNMELPQKERIKDMAEKNYQAWVKTYESFYGKKLEYTTKTK